MGIIKLSHSLAETLINAAIRKLISIAIYQPRLTILFRSIEEQLFIEKSVDVTASELMERKILAKQRLSAISVSFGSVADTVQSASLNKHLVYCLFDIILAELYPELNSTEK